MRTDDQWFQPGDKVMRVTRASSLGLPIAAIFPEVDFGKVLCVSRCEADAWNRVWFVGVPSLSGGFYAVCFRRVEEIKLCVRAAEKMKQPHEEQPA